MIIETILYIAGLLLTGALGYGIGKQAKDNEQGSEQPHDLY